MVFSTFIPRAAYSLAICSLSLCGLFLVLIQFIESESDWDFAMFSVAIYLISILMGLAGVLFSTWAILKINARKRMYYLALAANITPIVLWLLGAFLQFAKP